MATRPGVDDLLAGAGSPAEFNLLVDQLSGAGVRVSDSDIAAMLLNAGSTADRSRISGAVADANARAYGVRYPGYGSRSSGRSSSTPHFSAMPAAPGDNGDIVFESDGRRLESHDGGPIVETPAGQPMPSFSAMMSEPRLTAAQQQELAIRQAMRDEALMESEARALGTIAGRTGADAQSARQILGVPVSPGFENLIAPEQDAVIRDQRRQEAQARAQVEKYANNPGATQAQIDELWQQHNQTFPWAASGQRPVTRAEQMQQIQQAEEAATVEGIQQFGQRLGFQIPMRRDKDGQLEPVVSPSALIQLRQSQATARQNALDELTKLRAKKIPERPTLEDYRNPLSGAVDNAAYQTAVAEWESALDQQIAAAEQMYFGQPQQAPSQQQPAAVPPPQPTAPDAPVVQLGTSDEIAEGLAERRWQSGTILELDGFRAQVNPDGMTVTPIE